MRAKFATTDDAMAAPYIRMLRDASARKFQIFLVFLVFGIFVYSHVGLWYGLVFPDTREYLYLREHVHEGPGAWVHAFFARPILTGVYLAVVRNDLLAALGQSLLSFLAWLTLAHSVATLIGHRMWSRYVFLLFLAGALGRQSLFLNVAPVSESLSLSAACLMLAVLLRWADGRGSVVAVVLSAALLVFSRDVWSYWLLIVASAVLVLPSTRARGDRWRLAIALYAVVGVAMWSAASGERHIIPLKQAITYYVIDDTEASEFFAQRGFAMPPAQQLQCHREGHLRCQFDVGQESWLKEHGKSTYQAWLLHTLPQRIMVFATALPDALSKDLIFYIWSQRNVIYDGVSRVLPLGHVNFFYLLSLGVAATLLRVVLQLFKTSISARQHLLMQVGATVAVASTVTLFVGYWGDGVEVARHLLLSALLVAIGTWLALCALIEAAIERWYAHQVPVPGAA